MSFLGHVVPNVGCMHESKGPQTGIELVRPVEELVHHHSARPVRDCLDSTFRNSVLKMSSNATVRDGLGTHLEISFEFFLCERVIVCTKVFKFDAKESGKAIKAMFAFHGFSNAK